MYEKIENEVQAVLNRFEVRGDGKPVQPHILRYRLNQVRGTVSSKQHCYYLLTKLNDNYYN